MTADNIILATNKPVMALGGFGGSDPILTTDQLAALVSKGTVRYFLLGSFGGGRQIPPQFLEEIPEQFRDRFGDSSGGRGGFGGQQSALTSWVTQHCTSVTVGGNQLYDCASTH